MLEVIYTSNKTLSPALNDQMSLVYLHAWDAFVLYLHNAHGWHLYRMFRDGTLLEIGSSLYARGIVGSMPHGLHLWRAASAYWPGLFRVGDVITGMFTYAGTMFPAFPDGVGYLPSGLAIFLDYLQQRYVHVDLRYVNVFDAVAGTLAHQFDLHTYFHGLNQSLGWVDQNCLAVVDLTSGNFLLLDYVNCLVKNITTVRPCVAAAIDCANSCVVTVESDARVRVYALAVQSEGLSAPEFDSAPTQVHTKTGYRLKTRLIGSNGEPCPNKVIRWEQPLLGALEKEMSVTDADGYAWNFYFAPSEVTGAETISVGTI